MNTPKNNLRKDIEKRRANLPARPIYTPPSTPSTSGKPMKLWQVALMGLLLAGAGWCVGWAVSSRMQGDNFKISGLDNLPSKSRLLTHNTLNFDSGDAQPADTANATADASDKDAASTFANKAFLTGPYRTGEVLFNAGSAEALDALLQRAIAAGGTVLGVVRGANAARLSFPDAASMARFLRGGQGEDAIPNPELNYAVSLPTTPDVPNDPFAPAGARPFGDSALAYMGVPTDNANWGKGLTIAMLDTGLSPGTTNILKGGPISQYDVTGAGDVPPVGHGDMVASLIAGASGEQGISPGAGIMSVRVLDSSNQGNVFSVVDGIYTAIQNGAQILSLSLGTNQTSTMLQDAINYALSQNVVIVAAAGNDGTGQISYPAAYPGVIAVGSIDATGQRATFSDYGNQMGITAPGVGLDTVTTGGNMVFSGTSASAPLIAGAIAGLVSTIPNLTAEQAANLLSQYADFAGPVTATGSNQFYGVGIADVGRILDRGNTSLSDVAVADMYLNVTTMPTTPTAPMQVSIQNRGNTVLNSVQVGVNVNGVQTTETLSSMAPNEVRAIVVNLPVDQLLSPNGVQISAQADTGQQNDANPANNAKSRAVRLVSASSSSGT